MPKLKDIREEQLSIFTKYSDDCANFSSNISQMLDSNSGSISELTSIRDELRAFIAKTKDNRDRAAYVDFELQKLQSTANVDTQEHQSVYNSLHENIDNAKDILVKNINLRTGIPSEESFLDSIDMTSAPMGYEFKEYGLKFMIYGSSDGLYAGNEEVFDSILNSDNYKIEFEEPDDEDDGDDGDVPDSADASKVVKTIIHVICSATLPPGTPCGLIADAGAGVIDKIGKKGRCKGKVGKCLCRCEDEACDGMYGPDAGPEAPEPMTPDECNRRIMNCQSTCWNK